MEELQLIADLCKKHNVICISDEVYEWLVYGGEQHIRIGKLLFTISLFNFINIYGNNRCLHARLLLIMPSWSKSPCSLLFVIRSVITTCYKQRKLLENSVH